MNNNNNNNNNTKNKEHGITSTTTSNGKEKDLLSFKYVTSSFLDIYTTDGDLLNSALLI